MGQSHFAKKAGVKIATGSDAGFLRVHGKSASKLKKFVKGGFTPLEDDWRSDQDRRGMPADE